MTRRRENVLPWLIALTAVALVLRLVKLDNGLWLDEIYALVLQYRLPVTELLTFYAGDIQHPLYAMLASACVSVFGEHNWSIRLPAVLFGVASVPALYFLGAEVSSRREGLLAAALLTFSYHHVWFSQNARGYTALALCAILSTLYFVRLLRDPDQRNLWLYAVIAALGCYTHLTMVFVVAGHAMVFLLAQLFPGVQQGRVPNRWMPFAALVLAAVFTVVLYGPILAQVIDYFVNKPSGLKNLSTPMWALLETVKSLRIGFGTGLVVAAGGIMALVGLVSYLRTSPVVTGLFVMPAFFTILGAAIARGTMYPRFFFALAGFAILIGVRGVIVTFNWLAGLVPGSQPGRHAVSRVATTAVIIGILVSALSLARNYQYPKMDFTGARHWVESRKSPGDRVVAAGVAAWAYQQYFGLDWPQIESVEDFQRLAPDDASIWVVYTFARYLASSSPGLMAAIDQNCVDGRRFRGTLGGGDILVCRMQRFWSTERGS